MCAIVCVGSCVSVRVHACGARVCARIYACACIRAHSSSNLRTSRMSPARAAASTRSCKMGRGGGGGGGRDESGRLHARSIAESFLASRGSFLGWDPITDRRFMRIGALCALIGMAAEATAKRILCLHGSGGGARPFIATLDALRRASAPWAFEALDAPAGDGRWWRYPDGQRSFTASSYQGAEESIDLVEGHISRHAIDGVLGFSQGAMLAAIVAARASLGEGAAASQLKFAIIAAAAVPKPYEELLHRLREAEIRPLPTLHCLSAEDTMNPAAMGEEVAACFGPTAEVLWHGGGHALPPRADLGEVVSFLNRV